MSTRKKYDTYKYKGVIKFRRNLREGETFIMPSPHFDTVMENDKGITLKDILQQKTDHLE